MILTYAEQLTEALIEYLRPACLRIEAAGSVRRQVEDVGDLELVAIPDPRPPRPEFGRPKPFTSKVDELMHHLLEEASVMQVKAGPKFKQYRIYSSHFGLPAQTENINLDLFLVTPPADFGVLYLIRTGPADFSRWMVTQRFKGGPLPDELRVQDGAVWRGEEKVSIAEEADYFKLCGLAYVAPSLRRPAWQYVQQAVMA